MLSIICIAPIFGMEETNLSYVPKDIYNTIDEFTKENGEENDSFYEETGRITEHLPDPSNKQNAFIQFLQSTTGKTAAALSTAALFLTLPKILPKVTIPLASLSIIFAGVVLANQSIASHAPARAEVTSDPVKFADMVISLGTDTNAIVTQSFSSLSNNFSKFSPFQPKKLINRGNLTYELNDDEEVNIYLKDDYDSEPKNKLRSLVTPEKVIAFNVSLDGKTIAIADTGMRKLELQKRKDLYTIMESMHREEITDSD